MVGARTEAGPTAAEADTRMGAVRMEAVGRVIPAAAGISVPVARVAVASALAVAAATAGSAEAARRDTRRRRGRVAARTEARRHASRADIRRELTAAGPMVALAATVARTTARMPRGDLHTAAEDTETLGRGTPAAIVDRLMAETADRTAVRHKGAHTAARSKANVADPTATDMATTPRRIRVMAAAAVTDQL
jgi:hypothetical protein